MSTSAIVFAPRTNRLINLFASLVPLSRHPKKRQPKQDSNQSATTVVSSASAMELRLTLITAAKQQRNDVDFASIIRIDQSAPIKLLPLLRQSNHTHYNTILLFIVIFAVIIILLSITLLFVHTQACGNRIPIVGFVVRLFVCVFVVCVCRLYRTTVQQ